MNPLDAFDPIIDALADVRGPKGIILFIIMAGYIFKMAPNRWLPNYCIPLLNCFVIGPLLTGILIGWPTSTEMEPGVHWPNLAAWCWTYKKGFMLACVGWLIHGLVLKQIEKALKALGAKLDANGAPADTVLLMRPPPNK